MNIWILWETFQESILFICCKRSGGTVMAFNGLKRFLIYLNQNVSLYHHWASLLRLYIPPLTAGQLSYPFLPWLVTGPLWYKQMLKHQLNEMPAFHWGWRIESRTMEDARGLVGCSYSNARTGVACLGSVDVWYGMVRILIFMRSGAEWLGIVRRRIVWWREVMCCQVLLGLERYGKGFIFTGFARFIGAGPG